MKFSKLAKLELKYFIRSSIFSFLLLGFVLFLLAKSMQQTFFALNQNPQLSFFIILSTTIAVSYASIFMLSFNIEREKLSNVYHRYFILPLKPEIMFVIKLFFPILFSFVVASAWNIFIFMRFHSTNFLFFVTSILLSLLFIVGATLFFFFFTLTIRNISIVFAGKFLLIYILSYGPNFIISKGYSINFAEYGLVTFIIFVLIAGILFISHINAEKIVLA